MLSKYDMGKAGATAPGQPALSTSVFGIGSPRLLRKPEDELREAIKGNGKALPFSWIAVSLRSSP